MQAIQGLSAALPSYMIHSNSKMSVGLCATLCGTHVSLSAFQTLSNAETWTQTGKGLACAAIGVITTAAGLAMTAASLGLLESDPLPCIWMNEESVCENGVITFQCENENTLHMFHDKTEACFHLHNFKCKQNFFAVNCHGDTSIANAYFVGAKAFIEQEQKQVHPLSNNDFTVPYPRIFPFSHQQVQSANLSNSTTNESK